MGEKLGKKIFFLYPHSVIQDELVYEIVKNEYEAYLVFDHKKIIQELRNEKDSVLFINIDNDSMAQNEWEVYVRNLMKDKTFAVDIGILTYNNTPELAQKYLMDVGVRCGFVVLKLGLEQSRKIILKTLEANEAKGVRKYVRATCVPNTASFNVKYSGSLVKGTILDISSVGMSCSFSSAISPAKGVLFKEVQLILRGKIIMVDAVVLGSRELEDGGMLYVLLFGKKISPIDKGKIHHFIYDTLQQNLNSRLGI